MNQPCRPRIVIHYCTRCNWLLRAAWLAQELLSTFSEEIGEVALQPGTGGEFIVSCDDLEIWNRKTEARFPEAKELKQRIRDLIAPEKTLGHSERSIPD
ncbi:MAG: SelT/SelW/SelH family protein [Formivibrio sp.]|nr:SelT/SelW/SelH family protein [Formivibrio sp.]